MLEEFGYRVVEAADGEETVSRFLENKDKIDFLMIDVVLPKLNGREAYEKIKMIRPDIKALFTSGYTADIMHKKGLLEEGFEFISKPAAPKNLLKKIKEVLNK